MKFLIIGLGNIGVEYQDTRHNVGFRVLDFMAENFSVEFESVSRGDMARLKFKGRTFLLLKPATYMNLSGRAVRYWVQKEKVMPENLLVLVDDINLPLGKLRLRPRGSDGGHNGLRSIIEMLTTTEFARLRIGLGGSFPKGSQVDYVLGKWSDEELEKLPEILRDAVEIVKSFGTIGIERTMNIYN